MLFTASANKCFPKEKVDSATSGKGKYLLIMGVIRGMMSALATLSLVAQAMVLAGGLRPGTLREGSGALLEQHTAMGSKGEGGDVGILPKGPPWF